MFSIVPTPELHEATALFSPSAQGAAHLASVPMIAIPIPIQTPYAPDGPVFDFLFFQVYLFFTLWLRHGVSRVAFGSIQP